MSEPEEPPILDYRPPQHDQRETLSPRSRYWLIALSATVILLASNPIAWWLLVKVFPAAHVIFHVRPVGLAVVILVGHAIALLILLAAKLPVQRFTDAFGEEASASDPVGCAAFLFVLSFISSGCICGAGLAFTGF